MVRLHIFPFTTEIVGRKDAVYWIHYLGISEEFDSISDNDLT